MVIIQSKDHSNHFIISLNYNGFINQLIKHIKGDIIKHGQINPKLFVKVDISIKQIHEKFHDHCIYILAYKNHGMCIY
jgi:hypothetical protein